MKYEKLIFLLIAVLATFCIGMIGVAIGVHSWLIAILCIVAVFFLMGFGFTLRKKFREKREAR
ncbi:hypothetical protein A374_12865 [Fictibacillus macauensis ZFHKF-1]|uniref:YlaF family protein n=1 Tax=Fictibacillus macauensis ZFHKF-1 TaxID=1196324 RepID=I8UDQ6_9BACL|nr:YlaF family protein [Fictibacillus macauensis]EIT84938.1 hypothetical protein A374_12865 [Fictibacillus macauensis ZFHKF-1]